MSHELQTNDFLVQYLDSSDPSFFAFARYLESQRFWASRLSEADYFNLLEFLKDKDTWTTFFRSVQPSESLTDNLVNNESIYSGLNAKEKLSFRVRLLLFDQLGSSCSDGATAIFLEQQVAPQHAAVEQGKSLLAPLF